MHSAEDGPVQSVTLDESGVPDVISCVKYCVMEPECSSFNFESSTSRCQLNNATAKQFPNDLRNNVTSSDYYERLQTKAFVMNKIKIYSDEMP